MMTVLMLGYLRCVLLTVANFKGIIVITFYSPSCLGQETAKCGRPGKIQENGNYLKRALRKSCLPERYFEPTYNPIDFLVQRSSHAGCSSLASALVALPESTQKVH